MTGQWETRLRNIATGGVDFEVPAADELRSTLDDLAPVLQKAASDPGMTGESGLAATASFDAVAKHAVTVSDAAKQLQTAAGKANAVRAQAAQDLSNLPSGTLSGGDEALVRAAAAGATILLPGFSVIAGDGAVSAINWFLGNQRESHAQTAVRNASDSLDAIAVPLLPAPRQDQRTPTTDSAPGAPGGPGSSYGNYPGSNDDPLTIRAVPPGLSVGTGLAPIPRPGEPRPGDTGASPVSLHPVVVPPGGSLTVDGPTASGSSSIGTGGSSGGELGAGSAGGLLGNSSSALIAGGGSAALLGGGRMAAAGGFGGLAGQGGASGIGTSAVGSSGAGTAAGRGGGLLGRTGSGESAAATGNSAAGGRSAGASGAMGAGSRGGEQGSRDRSRGRGLGGPIAPQLDEDAELGARSEAAGAGGRG